MKPLLVSIAAILAALASLGSLRPSPLTRSQEMDGEGE